MLSASTDGLVALSDLKETDEDEAVQSAENFGQSIAKAGWYNHKGQMRIWGRSDMDSLGVWSVAKGEEEEIEVSSVFVAWDSRLHTNASSRADRAADWGRCRIW